jgi:Flp pilus assembly pilin Flp
MEAQSSRKLKMGSGCFAMLAVMFAVALVATGVGIVTEVDQKKLTGWSILFAGVAGLAAFIFFGYFARESAASSSAKERR